MTDLEISKALALAIGHRPGHVNVLGDRAQVWVQEHPGYAWSIRVFDYRDWNVIAPIAAKYNAFPVQFSGDVRWYSNAWIEALQCLDEAWADTPQKAIALAVIQGAKK